MLDTGKNELVYETITITFWVPDVLVADLLDVYFYKIILTLGHFLFI